MSVYLIRHGESEFNAAHNDGEPDPMIFDARLTAKGEAQARGARAEAAKLGIQQVIVSPLTRALQTATFIFGDLVPMKVSPEPRELLTHSCDVGRGPDVLSADFPNLSFDHLDDVWWHNGAPNDLGYAVEPDALFAARMARFAQSLDAMSPRPIAVVGHGNAFQELLGYHMKNCEIARYLA